MANDAKTVAAGISDAACKTCVHARDDACLRAGRHLQSYEKTYTDDDFCGPNMRHYFKAPWLAKVRAELEGKET